MHVSARSMEMTAVSAGIIQKILVEAAEVEPCRLPTMPDVSFERMRPILLVVERSLHQCNREFAWRTSTGIWPRGYCAPSRNEQTQNLLFIMLSLRCT
jgi:hypothetical protein